MSVLQMSGTISSFVRSARDSQFSSVVNVEEKGNSLLLSRRRVSTIA